MSKAIRRHQVSNLTSKVSAIPEVRSFLLNYQRQLAEMHDVIMDGRDIGTVVLPKADVKIFLTASPETRAERRMLELEEQGQTADYETILADIQQRDERDTRRTVAPLRQARDAVLLDTTKLDLEGSLAALLAIVKERIAQ